MSKATLRKSGFKVAFNGVEGQLTPLIQKYSIVNGTLRLTVIMTEDGIPEQVMAYNKINIILFNIEDQPIIDYNATVKFSGFEADGDVGNHDLSNYVLVYSILDFDVLDNVGGWQSDIINNYRHHGVLASTVLLNLDK